MTIIYTEILNSKNYLHNQKYLTRMNYKRNKGLDGDTDLLENKTKIRIGYILKFTEVSTIVSSRYSENLSQSTPVHIKAHLYTFMHTGTHVTHTRSWP